MSLFGKKDLSDREIKKIQQVITNTNVQTTIEKLMSDYQDTFYNNINQLDNESFKRVMTDFFTFIKNRKK